MRIVALRYTHRHGTDILLAQYKDYLPPITNELLRWLGVDDPELERDDEDAEWIGSYEVNELPQLDNFAENE